METRIGVGSGLAPLDEILQGLRPGDNVVWQVDSLGDYIPFAVPFADQAILAGRRCIYVRFAPHEPILQPRAGLEIVSVDPSPGFDSFSGEVHRIIQEQGREVCYVFDSLSALVVEWATDELLVNFFQVTCPYLFELDTVAYFALTHGQHAHGAMVRIRETTQVLINVYSAKGSTYVHPLKVWGRYSSQMFLPHRVSGESWQPVFSSGDAADVSTIARRRPLETEASSYAPWDSVYRRLVQYRETHLGTGPEIIALKREFARMMLGSQPNLNSLVDRYLTLDDLFNVRDRLIGSGQIGGKAAGMLLARGILFQCMGETDFSEVLENHDSFYIGSDVFFTFLVDNDLFRLRWQLIHDPCFSYAEFEQVEQRFLAGEFPPGIVEQFRDMLEYFGQAPIIVRSSSLLEDSLGNAFAGKYRSEFCANQGNPDERLEAFLQAVKLVYASALNPDVLSYRRRRGLIERDEQMAILVQRVSGRPYRNLFFPALAGVALSRNLYVWTDRLDSRKGIIRLVFGLGTRAVDRTGADYPRMIPISHPRLRPEIGTKVAEYSQRQLDLIDLQADRFVTCLLADVMPVPDYPNLHLLVSEVRDGGVYDPISRDIRAPVRDLALTFNNLIDRTDFVSVVGEMLVELERVYGHPVEIEFTASVEANATRINLLQCRPMEISGMARTVQFPETVPWERVLFRSNRFIGAGAVDRIRYIVCIDPQRYAAVETPQARHAVGRVVGQVNARLRQVDGKVLLMGPGRFGSSNMALGVPVTYADIDSAAVLVEVAREEAGQLPEVSFGTHFFQDLVEAQTVYLAIYPDDREAEFNQAFFARAPNCLAALLPDACEFKDLIRVLDVSSITGGRCARVVADPHRQRAICFLDDEEAPGASEASEAVV